MPKKVLWCLRILSGVSSLCPFSTATCYSDTLKNLLLRLKLFFPQVRNLFSSLLTRKFIFKQNRKSLVQPSFSTEWPVSRFQLYPPSLVQPFSLSQHILLTPSSTVTVYPKFGQVTPELTNYCPPAWECFKSIPQNWDNLMTSQGAHTPHFSMEDNSEDYLEEIEPHHCLQLPPRKLWQYARHKRKQTTPQLLFLHCSFSAGKKVMETAHESTHISTRTQERHIFWHCICIRQKGHGTINK